MGWLAKGSERDRIVDAFTFGHRSWVYETAERYVFEELDATEFSTTVLEQMALDQVRDPSRKVHFMDDENTEEGANRSLELRWYAVELMCDGQCVFFKFKFERDSEFRIKIVSVHDQKDPWGQT